MPHPVPAATEAAATSPAVLEPPVRSRLRRRPRRAPWWMRRAWRTWARFAQAVDRLRGLRRSGGEWRVLEAGENEEQAHEWHERRCGWFDSSQDLREGLQISEHAPDEPVAAELPVVAWVQLQLAGWRGGGPSLEAAQ